MKPLPDLISLLRSKIRGASLALPPEGNPLGEEEPASTREQNALQVTSILIPIAQARIDAQSQDWDSHDTKSLGLIAASLAAIGLLLTFRSSLHQLWWLSAAGLSISAVLFYMSVRRRRFNLGPDLRTFYQEFGIAPPLEASRHMLSQLFLAIDENDDTIPGKRRWFTWGERVLVATIVLSGLLLLLAPTVRATPGARTPTATSIP